jgi:2-polyprenyl-6-methoxyphenol hydroxylase-like FAD-dependent oxidoreductase
MLTTTYVKSSHVAIVGGSMAGCSSYIALKRAGLVGKVTVFERSTKAELKDRGLELVFLDRY